MGTKKSKSTSRQSKRSLSSEPVSPSKSDNGSPKTKKPKKRDSSRSSSTSSVVSNHVKNTSVRKKIMQTPRKLKQKMKPTSKELEYRKNKLKELGSISDCSKEFICTKCGYDYKNCTKDKEDVSTHPLMNVLLCKECCEYYGDGNFSLDSDNEDKYCRWCGEGGTIYSCSKCICGFCEKCIGKHFGKDAVKNVEKEDDWLCYFCNPQPLWYLRLICSLAKKKSMLENNETDRSDSNSVTDNCNAKLSKQSKHKKMSKRKSKAEPRSLIAETVKDSTSTSSDEEERTGLSSKDLSFESRRPMVIEKLENILKLTEHQMSFGLTWSKKKIKQLNEKCYSASESNLKKECRKVKWFISFLASYLVEFTNSVSFLEKEIGNEKETQPEEEKDASPSESASYATILKFLGFITNQVNTFSRKGIDLEELLNAEVCKEDDVEDTKNTEEAPIEAVPEEIVSADSSDDNGKEKPIFSPIQDEEIENIVTILQGESLENGQVN